MRPIFTPDRTSSTCTTRISRVLAAASWTPRCDKPCARSIRRVRPGLRKLSCARIATASDRCRGRAATTPPAPGRPSRFTLATGAPRADTGRVISAPRPALLALAIAVAVRRLRRRRSTCRASPARSPRPPRRRSAPAGGPVRAPRPPPRPPPYRPHGPARRRPTLPAAAPEIAAAPSAPTAAPSAVTGPVGAADDDDAAVAIVETASAERIVRPPAPHLPVASRWALPPIMTLTVAARRRERRAPRADGARTSPWPRPSRARVAKRRRRLGPRTARGAASRRARPAAGAGPRGPDGARAGDEPRRHPQDAGGAARAAGAPRARRSCWRRPRRTSPTPRARRRPAPASSRRSCRSTRRRARSTASTGASSRPSTSSRRASAPTPTCRPPGPSAGCSSCRRRGGRTAATPPATASPIPYDPYDAIYSAANYLEAAGARTDIAKAIWAYNHADWYVRMVLEAAHNLPEPFRSAG